MLKLYKLNLNLKFSFDIKLTEYNIINKIKVFCIDLIFQNQ